MVHLQNGFQKASVQTPINTKAPLLQWQTGDDKNTYAITPPHDQWIKTNPTAPVKFGDATVSTETFPSVIRTPAYPWLLDQSGFVKAGHVLKLIDILGSEPAFKHLQKNMKDQGTLVTASVDRTNFTNPIKLWEMISMESRLTQVWDSSLETQVKVYAENFRTGKKREVATAHLVFVGLDPKTRKVIKVPAYQPTSTEDKALAQAADIRKANRKTETKLTPDIPIDSATDNPVIIKRTMTDNDANAQDNVFGGIILDVIDEAGTAAAQRQALNGTAVGVRLDRMSFIAPTFVGEEVEAKAIITKTWQTSMEVKVEVEAVNPITGDRRKVADSYLVYVRLGKAGAPAEVPPYFPKTDAQKKRAESAEKRREIRKEEENS